MDQKPQGGPPQGFQISEEPPQRNGDPAYPPLPGYEGIGFAMASKFEERRFQLNDCALKFT